MKNLQKIIPAVLAVLLFGSCDRIIESNRLDEGLLPEENFKNPPVDARPRGLWTWVNGNYDSTEIWREIEVAKAKGMGGFDIWDAPTVQDPNSIVPIGTDQVSDEFMRGVKIAMQAARKNDFELGYIWNQSVSYTDPEHSHMAMYLTVATAEKSGEQTFKLPFPYIRPHKKHGYSILEQEDNGRPKYWGNVAVLAYPVQAEDTSLVNISEIVDLTGKVKDDNLTWNVPDGKWKILRFVWSRTAENGLTPTPATLKPALDFLNPEATEKHLSYLLELMVKHTGPLENSPMKYFCADSYEFKGLWTPKLPQIFEDSLGYNLIKYLPALKGYTVNDQETTNRFLFDYNNLISELVIANHYAKAREVCNRYGIGFTAEAAGPGPPVHLDVPMESIKSSGALSFPRGEFWVADNGRKREDLQIIKGIASAAHLYNQPYVSAEAFTGVHLFSYGPGDLKPYADRAFAEGLNRIDFHTFPHTPEVAGLPGWIYSFGNIISENLIWWPKADGFMNYLGRTSYLLQQGNFVGDALYYHGEAAPYFARPKHVKPELGLGYDYDITNADVLLNRLSVKNGKLTLPHGQQYEVLILPENNWMTLPVLQKIEVLLNDGATIVGPKPVKSNGLKNAQDEAVQQLASKIWIDLDGQQQTSKRVGKGVLVWGETSREVLMQKGIMPDIAFALNRKSDTLDYIHRKAGGVDFYFIRNPYDRKISAQVDFRITGKMPEKWDPLTGEIMPLSIYNNDRARTVIPLTMEPFESVFIVFRESATKNVAIEKNGHKVFPSDKVPSQWPFVDNGMGKISFLEEGDFSVNNNKVLDFSATTPTDYAVDSSIWKVEFKDPWNKQFSIETATLKSWTDFDEHRIKYFSGMAIYHNSFCLPKEEIDFKNQVILYLGRVEEVAEIFINGKSAGLVWNNPGKIDITGKVKAGINDLKIEVVNRWPNRMIGDYKLPENQRRIKSSIVTLPTAWHAPLESLPNEQYGLQPSGLLGPVSIRTYEVLVVEKSGKNN